jgi:hypothetical protein
MSAPLFASVFELRVEGVQHEQQYQETRGDVEALVDLLLAYDPYRTRAWLRELELTKAVAA